MSVTSLTIITAQNPNGIRYPASRNYDLNRRLWLDLKEQGYDMMQMTGTYAGHHEDSFLVFNVPRTKVIDLQKKYKQKAVIWGFVRTGIQEPSIHWQFIEQGKAVHHKLSPIPNSILDSPEDLKTGIRVGCWRLPEFEEIESRPDTAATEPEETPWVD